jgi:hypothetical protein
MKQRGANQRFDDTSKTATQHCPIDPSRAGQRCHDHVRIDDDSCRYHDFMIAYVLSCETMRWEQMGAATRAFFTRGGTF